MVKVLSIFVPNLICSLVSEESTFLGFFLFSLLFHFDFKSDDLVFFLPQDHILLLCVYARYLQVAQRECNEDTEECELEDELEGDCLHQERDHGVALKRRLQVLFHAKHYNLCIVDEAIGEAV